MLKQHNTSGILSLSTKLFYGVGDTGNAIVNSSVQFFLLFFYTDTAGISPSMAATALLIGKIWDAFNDPLVGWLSDRINSPLGKRRVLMIFGAIPLGVATALLWIVPSSFSNVMQFIWITGTFILWDSLWSLTNVPYYALTAELTDNYDERSSLTTVRMLFGVPAYMIGAAATPLIVDHFQSQRVGYTVIGIVYGVISASALLLCAFNIKEPPSVYKQTQGSTPLKEYREVFKNRPFVQLITLYSLCNIGFALVKTLFSYLITYQFGLEKHLVMFLMLLSVTLFLFPWKKLSERIDKAPSYAIGLAIGAIAMGSIYFIPKSSAGLVYIVAIVAGIGFSANWVFPWAMVPDVIEYDRLRQNSVNTGVYYGVWGFTYKLTEGLGIVIAGWTLDFFKYVPAEIQSETTLWGIRLFTGPVPAFLFILTIPLLVWYPVTRKKHQELCSMLAVQPISPKIIKKELEPV